MLCKFMTYPKKKQIYKEADMICAQFCDPKYNTSYLYIRTSLDNIAQQVLEHLKNEYPAHPIFSISAEQFSFWKDHNIDEDH